MIGIYKITNPKGKIYIGQSRRIKYRFKQYKRLDCKAQPKLFNSLNKYGVENHTFEVIDQCEIHELNNKERYYQMLFDVINPLRGLNLVLVGNDEMPFVYSDEYRLQISKRMKGNKNGLGTTYTDEMKLSISNRMIGNKNGLGKTHTLEVKINISNRMKGNKHGVGNKHSDEHKAYMSKKMLGNKNGLGNKSRLGKGRPKIDKKDAELLRFKLILNTYNGIFYYGSEEASKSVNINPNTLRAKLTGHIKTNNTPFIYV